MFGEQMLVTAQRVPASQVKKQECVGSRQRRQVPVPASVHPEDVSVLRGEQGPPQLATVEPAK